ncbi:IS3 family transposase [Geobacter sulfurreducens]|uniref:Transposase of ISGsu7 n=1 Tax=Geobacter sulfurreducens (strain ATCC 51573 / DSM 12127 / PCA) TaxID=243231 RepID=Q74F48_GEOSL|nr:IS3 family transposase [Geobacter sulfurreducens]KAB2909713.1 MAG: IS3 family transposase [Dechloromonas sp.]AAR33887.1 transposase of ISGsu7 [Geobacter sulfurreducens PCA]AAR34091.1 transposase of ISGsu7 [Geobacter sulfurreducens PCA]AAR34732.1 transposase of ISGsu7 [Geobacter sulfurreducens PCA]AAR35225.1 transposase of ISGsu7 [Geobacter sulfurreducens PCA]
MSATISPATGKAYGVQRVCLAWGVPRSSFYSRAGRKTLPAVLLKRGPKTPLSDDEVLSLIRTDLETSPFVGEGHRKVWGRLRFVKGIKVGRKRVLRLMRENNLLSPHRVVQGQPKDHAGKIITAAPNVMWGTDGTKIFTLEEGWCWLFTAVEHWNAECVGWHVTKNGDRFAALQPLAMGIKARFGSVGAAAARGLALRMDHGSQYLSEHFQNQIKFWGIAPSFSFVAEPQTNGVTERFNRTIKEQVIYGRHYRTIEEVRMAVADFMDRYNRLWLVEKLGFRSPRQAFEEYQLKKAA